MIYRLDLLDENLQLYAPGLWLGEEMSALGLKPPRRKVPPRTRFFFTEAGWKHFGEALMALARNKGLNPRIEKRKNPKASDIAYKDAWQVAIYP